MVLASFLQCRDMSWQSKAAAEAALLLKEQQKLERETGQVLFVGLSLADTLATCFRLGHASAAARLRKTFAVPEARWYWLKLTALAAAHDWDGENAMLCRASTAIELAAVASMRAAGQHTCGNKTQCRTQCRKSTVLTSFRPRWHAKECTAMLALGWLVSSLLSVLHRKDMHAALPAGLDAFAAERRSPIGWEPFIQAAAQHGAPQEIQMR